MIRDSSDATARRIPSSRAEAHPDVRFPFPGVLDEPIDPRQDFLHFVTDHIPAQYERLAEDPFAMRVMRVKPGDGAAGKLIRAIDQRRHEDLATVLRQPPRVLKIR